MQLIEYEIKDESEEWKNQNPFILYFLNITADYLF